MMDLLNRTSFYKLQELVFKTIGDTIEMLRKLQIQHYAIIDAIEIDFSAQLNIITGETGAGKSIMLGALGLLLGERADSDVLFDKEKKQIEIK